MKLKLSSLLIIVVLIFVGYYYFIYTPSVKKVPAEPKMPADQPVYSGGVYQPPDQEVPMGVQMETPLGEMDEYHDYRSSTDPHITLLEDIYDHMDGHVVHPHDFYDDMPSGNVRPDNIDETIL